MFNDLDVSKTGTLTVEELKGALVDFPEIAEQIETLVRERERERAKRHFFSRAFAVRTFSRIFGSPTSYLLRHEAPKTYRCIRFFT